MVNSDGKLRVVGTGITISGQLTQESRNVIRNADIVFAVMAEPLALEFLSELNASVTSLSLQYATGRQRDDTYERMIQEILAPVWKGQYVCAAFYGHPGVFVWPAHECIRRAQTAGYPASMLPGISAEDCLIADLGLDPGVSGIQAYEASDFYLYPRQFDPCTPLILWQLAALGDITRSQFVTDVRWVEALVMVLSEIYGANHTVVVYEAAAFPLDSPRIESIPLHRLALLAFTQASTMVIPPKSAPSISESRLKVLGVDENHLVKAAFQQYREQQFGLNNGDELD